MISPVQAISLFDEVTSAEGLLRAGLVELRRIDGANRFYRLPFSLIAQGLERLMKVAIALVALEDNGRLPTSQEMRQHKHDLGRLLVEVANIASRANYSGRPAAVDDAHFLTTDQELRQLLAAIQGFGDQERYADLDRFLGGPASAADPQQRVEAFELQILEKHPEWQERLGSADFGGFYPLVTDEMTALVLRLARAVARFFVWGPAGDLGKQASGRLHPLLTLRDPQLSSLPESWASPVTRP